MEQLYQSIIRSDNIEDSMSKLGFGTSRSLFMYAHTVHNDDSLKYAFVTILARRSLVSAKTSFLMKMK